MKTFNYTINGSHLSIRLDEKSGTIAELQVDGKFPIPTEDEMRHYAAAIALALIEYQVEDVHDDEAGVITLNHTESSWNSPYELMNRLDGRI